MRVRQSTFPALLLLAQCHTVNCSESQAFCAGLYTGGTEHVGVVTNCNLVRIWEIPDSFTLGITPSWLRFFVVFLIPRRHAGMVPYLDHDGILQNPNNFVMYLSPYHRRLQSDVLYHMYHK
jgi:hypothetical protein